MHVNTILRYLFVLFTFIKFLAVNITRCHEETDKDDDESSAHSATQTIDHICYWKMCKNINDVGLSV